MAAPVLATIPVFETPMPAPAPEAQPMAVAQAPAPEAQPVAVVEAPAPAVQVQAAPATQIVN